jgi:hypothetical protein
MKGDKAPSLQDMFQALMVNDGRGDEYKELHERAIAADGRWGAVSRTRWEVMKEMGYLPGQANSIRVRYNMLFGNDPVVMAVEQEKLKVAVAEAAVHDLEITLAEMKDLPPVASPALELEWVGGHPAMMRRDLQPPGPPTTVFLKPEDVTSAPHGLPPSRRAVYRLANWANRPDKFHEQLLGVDKKAEYVGSGAASQEEATDMTLQEVRELIKLFAVGQRHDWS